MLLSPDILEQPRVRMHWLRVGHCVQLEALARKGAPWRRIEFPSYVAAIEHPVHGWTLFDTGYSEHFAVATRQLPERLYAMLLPVTLPPEQELPTQLRALGVEPAEIRRVVLSHFHGDHASGLPDYPNATVLAGGAGAAQVRRLRRRRLAATRHGLLPRLLPEHPEESMRAVEDLPAVDVAGFTGRDLLGDGSLVAIDLPGHMPGHLGLLLTDESGRQALCIGDAAWSSAAVDADTPPSRLAATNFDDAGTYRQTLTRLHRFSLEHPDLVVLPSHCPEAAETWWG